MTTGANSSVKPAEGALLRRLSLGGAAIHRAALSVLQVLLTSAAQNGDVIALIRRILHVVQPPFRLHHVYERLLGTEVEVQVVARTQHQAEAAEAAALDELQRLSLLLNRFDPASEWSRLLTQVDVPVQLSPEVRRVMTEADTWRSRSGGAFHPGADALGEVWKAAAAAGQAPSPADLARLVQALRANPWTLHADGSATLHASYPLGLNALAKGFIVDQMVEVALASPGVQTVLVNAGGDLRTQGGTGVRVAVADPRTAHDNAPPITTVPVRNGALASSGRAHRGYDVGGQWHSHLIDPRSGQPVRNLPGVTVTAPDTLTADALATALSVLDVHEGLALVDQTPGSAALLLTSAGQLHQSQRWGKPRSR